MKGFRPPVLNMKGDLREPLGMSEFFCLFVVVVFCLLEERRRSNNIPVKINR